MKQPELGKRIVALRKSKGLTQEELVDRCNINVRTIQRIEAGDVTPRSFTIKSILEALEVDSDTFFPPNKEAIQFSDKDIKALRISWIAAIFFTIFTVMNIFTEAFIISNYNGMSISEELLYRIISGILSLAALMAFLRGYKTLGDRFENKTLVSAAYIYFTLDFIMILITILMTAYNASERIVEVFTGIILILLLGVAELILGVGIQKLKTQLGSFANAVGVLKIINGALLLTVILAPLSLFIAIPILIVETVFLYKTTQKVGV